MKQSKKTLPLLLALSAMGLSACNFAGGSAQSVTPGGGGKEDTSMSAVQSGFNQTVFDYFFKDGAFYRNDTTLDFRVGTEGGNNYSFGRKNNVITLQRMGGDVIKNPEFFRLSKNPSSLDEKISVTRYYDHKVAGVTEYFYETVETSLKEILLDTGLPLISLDCGSFRLSQGANNVTLRGENIALSVGQTTRNYNIEISFVSEKGSGVMQPWEWKISRFTLTSGEETIYVDVNLRVPSDYYPNQAAEWADFHFELNEDGESYTVVDTMLDELVLTVPATHNGKPVTRIGVEFTAGNYYSSIMRLILPDTITEIDKSFTTWIALREIVGKNLGAMPDDMSTRVRFLQSEADSWLDFRDDGFIVAPYSWDSESASPGEMMVLGDWKRPEGKLTLPDGPTVVMSLHGLGDVTDLVVPEGYRTLNPGFLQSTKLNALKNVSLPDSLDNFTYSNGLNVPYSVNYNVKDGLRYLGNAGNPYLLCFGVEGDYDDWASRKTLSVAEGCKILCLDRLAFNDYEEQPQVRFEELYVPSSVRLVTGTVYSEAYSTLTKITWLGGQMSFRSDSVFSDVKEIVVGPNVTNSRLSGYYFPNVEKLTLDGDVSPSFSEHKKLQEVTLGESFAKLPRNAFYGCASLSTLTIKNPAVIIGEGAFTRTAISMVKEGGFTYLPVGDNRHAILISGEIKTATASIHAGVKSISDKAITLKVAGPEITLPSGLVSLGESPFIRTSYASSYVATIKNLPSTLKTIGSYALYGCYVHGSLPTGLTRIDDYAFNQAKFAQPELVLPASLEMVKPYAFEYTNVTKVTFLGDGAPFWGASYLFAYCESLKEVAFESSFDYIPQGMFEYCSALDEFAYPKGLVGIGSNAFEGVPITDALLHIPEGVVGIGAAIFGTLEGQVTVHLPSTLESIGRLNLSPEAKVTVAEGNKHFAIGEDGCLYNTSFTTLYVYVGGATKEYVMPDSVLSIAPSAFAGSDVRSIVAGKGLSTLYEDAISGAPCLVSVDLSSATMSSLGYSAIRGNHLLSHIVFPKGLKVLGSYCLQGNGFTRLEIPEGVETIYTGALGYNPLYQLTLPNSLKELDPYFLDGNGLATEIVYAGEETFEINPQYTSGFTIVTPEESRYELRDDGFVTSTDAEGKVHLFDVTKDEKVVTLPEDIDVIEKSAFSNLTKMEKVIVSGHVSAIDTRLFRDFPNHDYVFDWGGDLYELRNALDAYDGSGIDTWREEGTTPEGKLIYLTNINTWNKAEITFNVNPHVHAFSDWTVSYPPVCDDPGEDGYKTRTCTKCGTVEGETIEHSLEHEYEWEYTDLPTAASLADAYLHGKYKINGDGNYAAMRKGSKTGTCAHCGDKVTKDALYGNICYFSHVISAINAKGACPDKVNYIQSYLRGSTGGWNLTNTYKHQSASGFAAKTAANTLTTAMWDELSSEYETNSALFSRYWKVVQDASTAVFYEVELSSRTEAKTLKLLIDEYGRIHTRVVQVGLNVTQEEVIVWAYDKNYESSN